MPEAAGQGKGGAQTGRAGGRVAGRTLKVHLAGRYAHRQPLAHAPVRDALGGRIAPGPAEAADLIVIAHWKDLAALPPMGAGQGLVLLSEEPFWDTLWTPQPFRRRRPLPEGHALAGRRLTLLNHFTSRIFAFDRLPYFPLTDPRFAERYVAMCADNARLSAEEWRRRLAASPLAAAFLAERREHPNHDIAFPEAGVMGLAAHRTRIALACARAGGDAVLCAGAGWGEAPRRQDLPDWHADKLDRLSGRCRTISAIENTHHRDYVTEKPFDAFAAGAVPLAIAGAGHRLHDLLPEGAWLDLTGLSPQAAAAKVLAFSPGRAEAEAFRAGQAALAALWSDKAIIAAELARLADALVAELTAAAG